jgi:glycosyltransferase involved in cell wall biosynthesis
LTISILLPDLRGGGAERVSLDLAREFSRLGQDVEFVLMRAEGEFLPTAQLEFSVVDLVAPRMRGVPTAVARYLREHKPDVVVANMWPLTSAAVIARAMSGHKCRLLLVEHNNLTQQYSLWGKLHARLMAASMAATYRFADVVAAVSKGAAKDTAGLARLPNDRVKVLHNPIPQRQPPNPEKTANAEILWDCLPGQRILTVGSLSEQKNHPLLLRAFADLQYPEARLMLLGQGAKKAMLRAMAAELGIADRVIFAGFHPDPTPFYKTANLFVLSSNYEGLPTVLIEALGCGTPVVSTDCPSGPAEILVNGKYGRLIPVGDAEKLAKGIEEALQASHDTDALISRAAEFSPSTAAQSYLKVMFDDA